MILVIEHVPYRQEPGNSMPMELLQEVLASVGCKTFKSGSLIAELAPPSQRA